MPYSAERAAAKWELFQSSITKDTTPTRGAPSPNRDSTLTWGIPASPARTRAIRRCSRATSGAKPASVSAVQAEAME